MVAPGVRMSLVRRQQEEFLARALPVNGCGVAWVLSRNERSRLEHRAARQRQRIRHFRAKGKTFPLEGRRVPAGGMPDGASRNPGALRLSADSGIQRRILEEA